VSRGRAFRILGVVALVLVAAAWGGPAGADDITGTVQRVGWWTDRAGAQPTIEPASFEVSFGTDKEPTSVAALDVAVPVGPVQTLQLSLTELAGTANGLGHVRVCLAAPGWATANAGALADAPTMDCTDAADLTRSLDGSWLGEISGLIPNGGTASLGVLLVNDLNLPVTLGATVQISDIAITGQSADGAGPTETTAPPVTTPDGGFDDSFVEPSPGFVPPTGGFDAPPLETPDQPAATTTTTAAPPPPLLPASFEEGGPPWVRLVILIPLALGIGFATVHGRRFLEARGISLSD
jgi:hypothetical protein